MGELDAALDDFSAARRLDEAVAEAYHRKGEDLQRQGDAEGAHEWIQRSQLLRSMLRDRQADREPAAAVDFPDDAPPSDAAGGSADSTFGNAELTE
jgi:hypothetical protein